MTVVHPVPGYFAMQVTAVQQNKKFDGYTDIDTFTLRWYHSTPSTGSLAHSLFQTSKLVSLVTAIFGYCSNTPAILCVHYRPMG